MPNVKRVKFDAKGGKLVFVGYCEDRKAYRFLDPEDDSITISRDVYFIEQKNGSSSNGPGGTSESDVVDLPWPGLTSMEGKLQMEPGSALFLRSKQNPMKNFTAAKKTRLKRNRRRSPEEAVLPANALREEICQYGSTITSWMLLWPWKQNQRVIARQSLDLKRICGPKPCVKSSSR